MDENMEQGFPIPAGKPMFGGEEAVEEAPAGETFKAFTNDTGDLAVVLSTAEVEDGEVIERLSPEDLETYAQDLLNGGSDDRGLQIGEMYEGESAEADAEAEALRLEQEFKPIDDSDGALAAAVENAKGGGAGEVPFPEDEGTDELGTPFGEQGEMLGGEAEEEPMLDQLKKKAKGIGG